MGPDDLPTEVDYIFHCEKKDNEDKRKVNQVGCVTLLLILLLGALVFFMRGANNG